MNETFKRVKDVLDEINFSHEEHGTALQVVRSTNVCNYISEIKESTTNRVSVTFAMKIELGSKNLAEIIEVLNAINLEVMFGRFSVLPQPGVFYHSSLAKLSPSFPSKKLALFFSEKEKAFLAMNLVLEQYKAGQLSMEQIGAEFLRQKNGLVIGE